MLNMATLKIFTEFCEQRGSTGPRPNPSSGASASPLESPSEGTVRIVNQVHDELILEVPEAEVVRYEVVLAMPTLPFFSTQLICLRAWLWAKATVAAFVRQAMENPVGLSVPVKVNIQVGKNWEEMENYGRVSI